MPRRRPNDIIDYTRRAWTGSLTYVIGYMVQVWLRRSALPARIGKIADQSQYGIYQTTDVLAVPGRPCPSRSWDFFCSVRVRDFLSKVEQTLNPKSLCNKCG